SATHAHHCFGCIADIADIALLANSIRGDSEHPFQQTLMELNDIERLLAQRHTGEEFGRIAAWRIDQERAICSNGQQSSSGISCFSENCRRATGVNRAIHFIHAEVSASLVTKRVRGK